jgi:hypothetical protein
MQFENPRDHIIELEKRLDETENQLNELTTHVVTLEGIMMAIAKAVLPMEDFEELQETDETEE